MLGILNERTKLGGLDFILFENLKTSDLKPSVLKTGPNRQLRPLTGDFSGLGLI